MREFTSEETRALLISPIRFDNELQNCYNIDVLSSTIYQRMTERADYPRKQEVKLQVF